MRVFHDLVDTYFVSQIPGFASESISAISATFPITFMYIAIGIGLSVAGTALISQYYGNGQLDSAKKYATNLLIISLAIGLLLNILSYLFAPWIFQTMGASGYVLENAVNYIRIRSFELIPIFGFFAFQAIRQASGDTITPTYLGIGGIITNIILTPLFVLDSISLSLPIIGMMTVNGLGLGVSGAAFATLTSSLLILPIATLILIKSKSGVTIAKEYILPNPKVAKYIIHTAIPASLGQSITAVGFAVLNTFIIDYGYDTYSAFSVGNRVSSLFLMPVMAIGGVMASYIGQNIGNLNPKRARSAFLQGMLLSIVLMSLGSFIGYIFRYDMAKLFLSEDPQALALSVEYLKYLMIGLPLMAIFQSYIGLYNGSGKTMYTMWLGITRLWLLRIPMILIFKEFTQLGSSGIWYAMLLSNLFISFIGFFMARKIDYQPKIDLQ
jgi:putative MATE family efflux protein